MASYTLYDPPATNVQWDEGLLNAKPCVTVKLLDHDPKQHQLSCNAEKEKAYAVVEHMLDVVLGRAVGHTRVVISSMPPFTQSSSLLSFLFSSSLLSSSSPPLSLCSHIPPVRIPNRGYSADAVFRSVRTLVELDSGAVIYEKLKKALEAYVICVLQELTAVCEDDPTGDLTFLRLIHIWGHYRLAIAELQEVWVYMDRCYISRVRPVQSIDGLAVAIMKKVLLQHPWLLSRGQAGYLAYMRRDLGREVNARQEIRLFTNLCISIGVYFLRVEPDILSIAREFYEGVAEEMWRNGDSTEVFFQQVDHFLQEGRECVQACLDVSTLPKLEEVAQTSLLVARGTDVLARDFPRLVREEKYDCIRFALGFLLLAPYVRLEKECGLIFRQYILHEGTTIMRQLKSRPAKEEEFSVVKSMITLICRGERVVEECFSEAPMSFPVHLNDALVEVMQENQTEFARQIAKYTDWLLREGGNDMLLTAAGSNTNDTTTTTTTTTSADLLPHDDDAEEEDDKKINNNRRHHSATSSPKEFSQNSRARASSGTSATASPFVSGSVLKYIGHIYALFPSKDVFESFYWRDLARRLLHYQSSSRLSIEMGFIQELKETGGVDTSRFEGMISDFKTSNELDERYQAWVEERCDATTTSTTTTTTPAPWTPVMQIDNEEEDEVREATKGNKKTEITLERNEEEDVEAMPLVSAMLRKTKVKLHILTSGFWPTQTVLEMCLPDPLSTLAKCVQQFYRHCFADRQLVWQHQLSLAVVACTLGGVRRQFTGTLLQVSMLLSMQETMDAALSSGSSNVVITVGGLCEQLGVDISLPIVLGSIYGLCHEQRGLLLRESTSTSTSMDLAATDRLQFRQNITAGTIQSRIPFHNPQPGGGSSSSLIGGGDRGDAEGTGSIDDEVKRHSHVIEAAVVRFMKERRCVTHEELIAAIPTLVRFHVSMPAVKFVIERLLGRGFLERNGPTGYKYSL